MRLGVDKATLDRWAAGPPAVQRLQQAPVVGPAARSLWKWWFAHRLDRFYRRGDAEAVARFAASMPALDAVQRRVVDDLNRRGVAMVAAHEFFGSDEPFATLRHEVDLWLASPDVQAREQRYRDQPTDHSEKAYLLRMFGPGSHFGWDSAWLQMAAHQRMLDVVNTYLGLHARINYIDAWNTLPLVRTGPDVGSQRWHRDPDAPKLVKVFTYFTDVTPDSGPLVVIPQSRGGERHGNLWPQEFPRGSHPPPDVLERRIPQSEWVVCTVPTGTMVFADTSSFHRGGRATVSRRVLALSSYVPPSSVWPRRYTVDPGSLPATLSPAARVALTSSYD